MRRNALAFWPAKAAVAARHNRAAQREQDRVIAREAPFRFKQNKSAKLRPAIENIDDTLVAEALALKGPSTAPVSTNA